MSSQPATAQSDHAVYLVAIDSIRPPTTSSRLHAVSEEGTTSLTQGCHGVAEETLVGLHLIPVRTVHHLELRRVANQFLAGRFTRAPMAIVTSGLSRKRT